MTITLERARRLTLSHFAAIAALGLFAGSCAPGQPLDGGQDLSPDDVLAVHLAPDSVSLKPSEYIDFTAIAELKGGGNSSVPVEWEATGGTITANGRYTAGDSTGLHKAIGRYRNGKSDTSIVVIEPSPTPVLSGVSVTPSSSTLAPGATQQFSVTGVMSDGSNTHVAVNWRATGGTVTSSGFYTAPSSQGSFLVIATEQTGTLADTAAVTITSSSSISYTTAFPLTENPISEGGVWRHTDPTLTPVQTIGGRACGTQTGSNNLDDSNAYLTGFGANYEIEAIVYLNPNLPSDGVTREVELLLRWTDDNPLYDPGLGPTHAKGYEININTGGAGGLGRFKGAELAVWGAAVHNGDKFRARIEGQRIRAWWNDVLKIDHTDSDPSLKVTTGNPGIGYFIRSPAANTDFCFESATVTALP